MADEMAEERKGEPARKAGYQMHAWMKPKTKEQKAQELTRKMKKGYRKGYRVGKRPDNKPASPYRKSKRGSGRTRQSGR